VTTKKAREEPERAREKGGQAGAMKNQHPPVPVTVMYYSL
jgi:hypothetical protein